MNRPYGIKYGFLEVPINEFSEAPIMLISNMTMIDLCATIIHDTLGFNGISGLLGNGVPQIRQACGRTGSANHDPL